MLKHAMKKLWKGILPLVLVIFILPSTVFAGNSYTGTQFVKNGKGQNLPIPFQGTWSASDKTNSKNKLQMTLTQHSASVYKLDVKALYEGAISMINADIGFDNEKIELCTPGGSSISGAANYAPKSNLGAWEYPSLDEWAPVGAGGVGTGTQGTNLPASMYVNAGYTQDYPHVLNEKYGWAEAFSYDAPGQSTKDMSKNFLNSSEDTFTIKYKVKDKANAHTDNATYGTVPGDGLGQYGIKDGDDVDNTSLGYNGWYWNELNNESIQGGSPWQKANYKYDSNELIQPAGGLHLGTLYFKMRNTYELEDLTPSSFHNETASVAGTNHASLTTNGQAITPSGTDYIMKYGSTINGRSNTYYSAGLSLVGFPIEPETPTDDDITINAATLSRVYFDGSIKPIPVPAPAPAGSNTGVHGLGELTLEVDTDLTAGTNWVLSTSLPDDLPVGVYDLRVSATEGEAYGPVTNLALSEKFTVTPKPLEITDSMLAIYTKEYDGLTTIANVSNKTQEIATGTNNEHLNITLSSGTYDSKDVATATEITSAGFTPSNGTTSTVGIPTNYDLTYPASVTAKITKKGAPPEPTPTPTPDPSATPTPTPDPSATPEVTPTPTPPGWHVDDADFTVNVEKTYDGTTDLGTLTEGADNTRIEVDGVNGEKLYFALTAGTWTSANQGTGLRFYDAVFHYYDAPTGTAETIVANYEITTDLTGTINKAPLTISANDKTKVYGAADPTWTAESDFTITGYVPSEGWATLSTKPTGAMIGGTAGTGRAAANYAVDVSGTVADNYDITETPGNTTYTTSNSATEGGTLEVTKRTLTGTWATTDKTYDGNQTIVVTFTPNNVVGTDDVAVRATGTIATSANVGTRAVTISSAALTGSMSLSNYNLPTITSPNATINPKALTITAATPTSKTYDGTADVTVTSVTFSGLENGENLVLDTDFTVDNTGNLSSADIGSRSLYVNVISLGTTKMGNYTITDSNGGGTAGQFTQSFNITGKTLTITAATPTSKTYDKTNSVTVTGVTFSGLENGENLILGTDYTVNNTGNLNSANASTNATNPCTSLYVDIIPLSAKMGNYTITDSNGGTAGQFTQGFTINRKALNAKTDGTNYDLGWTVAVQEYDGAAKTPKPSNTYGLAETTDYTISAIAYGNNINAGTATVQLVATAGNYSGNVTLSFTINKRQTPSNGSDFEVSYDSISAETGKAMADPENPHGKGVVSLIMLNGQQLTTGPSETFTIEYLQAGVVKYTAPTVPTVAGKYNIRITIPGNGNFLADTVVIANGFKVREADEIIIVGPDPLEPDPFIPDPDTTYTIQVFPGYSADIDLGGGKHVGIGNSNSPLTFTDDNENGSVTFKIGPNQPKVIIVIDADITITDNWNIGNASTEYLVVIEKGAEVTVQPDVVIKIHEDSHAQQGKKLESGTGTYITLPDETIIGLVEDWVDGNKTLTAIGVGQLEFINKKLMLTYKPYQTENVVNFIGHFNFQGNEDPSDVEGIRLMVYKNEGLVGELEAAYIQRGIGVDSNIVTITFDHMLPDTYDRMVLYKENYTSVTMTNVTITGTVIPRAYVQEDGSDRNTDNDLDIYVGDQVADIYFYAGDVNNDGRIDDYDISTMRLYFGSERLAFDFNKNGHVDGLDLVLVEGNYGKRGVKIPEGQVYYTNPLIP